MTALSFEIPEELVERIAERAAELAAERRDGGEADGGFLDVRGAAEFLACSTSRVYTLVSSRRLPVHRDGSRLLFERAELREYVRQGGARCP